MDGHRRRMKARWLVLAARIVTVLGGSGSQPIDYFEALVASGSSSGQCSASTRVPSLDKACFASDRAISMVVFGGSMTAGDPLHIGKFCEGAQVTPGAACASKRGQPYAVLLARRLVEAGLARTAFVRNLADGALHGAAVPALCADSFLTNEHLRIGYSCEDLHCLHGKWGSGPERYWYPIACADARTKAFYPLMIPEALDFSHSSAPG
jgi:hypothetical protein